MRRWETFKVNSAPNYAGVYVIYVDGYLAYVGSSKHIRTRLSGHGLFRLDNGKMVRLFRMTLACPPIHQRGIVVKVKKSRRFGDWAMDELRLIRRLNPRMNYAHCSQSGRSRAA